MFAPSIGTGETILLAVAILIVLASSVRARWLLGVIPCLATAALITPADPVRFLIAGGLLAALYLGLVGLVVLSRRASS